VSDHGCAERGGDAGIGDSGKPSVALHVLGCKVNQYDARVLRERFSREGFRVLDSSARADVYVVASCAVTREAAAKTRQMVRRARRENPQGAVLLVGCYPQAVLGSSTSDPEEGVRLRDLPADGIFGVGSLDEVVNAALDMLRVRASRRDRVCDIWNSPAGSQPFALSSFDSHTRASVKVQDGCDEFCSYCLIPHLRGPLRARPYDEVEKEVRHMLRGGHREIVLTGIHLGAYDRSPGADVSLLQLVRRLSRVGGRWRLRISSLEPMDVDPALFSVMAESQRIARHLHLPLQSGSDEVLRSMDRRYDTAQYRELVRAARRVMPDAGISTDVMVGFPTETEGQHRASLEFVREMGFSRVHVFPYSPRPGTRAASMEDGVPGEVRRRRRDEMLEAAGQLAEQFHYSLRGKSVDILVERQLRGTRDKLPFDPADDNVPVAYGYSGNYAPVWIADRSACETVGQLLAVRIVHSGRRGCLGRREGECAGRVTDA